MRVLKWADLAAKVFLLALLVSALVWPDLSGVKEKAGTARLVIYPLGAAVVPVWWRLSGRRRAVADGSTPARGYPWAADLLITLPWFLDLLGNRLNLFDTVVWWDDLMHFLNWLLLTAGALLVGTFQRPALSRGVLLMCALGFGVTAAVLWELGEYVAFVRGSPELATAYTDTLGDLALGTLGAVCAGLAIGQLQARGMLTVSSQTHSGGFTAR